VVDVLDDTLVSLRDVDSHGTFARRTTGAHVVSVWGLDAPGT
jgi:hypothetical protein